MTTPVFQVIAQMVLSMLGTWFYARELPKREDFNLRVVGTVLGAAAVMALAVTMGYTLYPPLTDDRSFFLAIGSLAIVLALLTGGVLFVYRAPLLTALFCSSSGYLIQSIVFGVDRIVHFSGVLDAFKSGYAEGAPISAVDALSLLVTSVVVCLIVWKTMASQLQRSGLLGIRNPMMLFAVALAIAVSLIFDLAIKDIPMYEMPWRYPVVLAAIYVAVCLFILIAEFEILYNQVLKADVATMERAMAEQEHQFELSRDTISAINRRVHDIRHHVMRLIEADEGALEKSTLRDIAREINVYDAAVKTGNASLDVVLTEKGLLCRRAGITFSSIADGSALDFMSAADIYTFFGNAIDNAIAAVEEAGDDEHRSIALVVKSQMGMASVSIENYLASPVQIVDGMPAGEGFGAEKMRAIIDRYNGTLVFSNDGDVFHLEALIPQP